MTVLYYSLLFYLIGGCIAEFWDRQDVGAFRRFSRPYQRSIAARTIAILFKTGPPLLLLPSLTGY